MSYNPCIDIKTKSGNCILSCDFSGRGRAGDLESMLFKLIDELVNRGLASYTEDTVDRFYPAVLKVHKVNVSVKNIIIPIVEEITTGDSGLHTARHHYERTANDDNLTKEHERWKASIENTKQRIASGLDALKTFPEDEGIIIEAWGML